VDNDNGYDLRSGSGIGGIGNHHSAFNIQQYQETGNMKNAVTTSTSYLPRTNHPVMNIPHHHYPHPWIADDDGQGQGVGGFGFVMSRPRECDFDHHRVNHHGASKRYVRHILWMIVL